MTKPTRKSIVANFGLLSAELESDQAREPKAPSPTPVARVGAGVIGAAHRAIDDIRAERDRLRAIVENGGGMILELAPELIDPSPYPDRLPDDDGMDFDLFKRSIETEGQKVPIQVRPHPSSSGRYQIVYGHRRWRAARDLGRLVRAIEVEINDIDLVVAQGIENASRQDLTWIERALFASRMDDAGIKARDIYASLSISDAELARMRTVYRSIPADLIELIGRAPKIGRPRWVDLAKAIASNPNLLDAIRLVLQKTLDAGEGSDERFQQALIATKPPAVPRPGPIMIADASGRKLGSVTHSPREIRISAEGTWGIQFIKYVEDQLPDLAQQFIRQQDTEKP